MLFRDTLKKPIKLIKGSFTLLIFLIIVASNPSITVAQRSRLPRPASSRNVANPRQVEIPYTLGGGDRVSIDVLGVPELTGEYQVTVDGSLFLPLVGRVPVAGLTLEQAVNAITVRYNSVLKSPVITLNLIAPRPVNISVLGEVNRPGSFTIKLTEGVTGRVGVQYPTLKQAIELAEGVTLTADLSRIQIRRQQRLGSPQVINVDLMRFLQTGDSSQNIALRDGDSLFVPTANVVTLAQARQIAISGFAAPLEKPRTVSLVGEVNRPGSYVLLGGATGTDRASGGLPTVTRAIQLAGGVNSSADLRGIQIRRLTKAGRQQTINVNLWQFLQSGDATQDTILQEGDTIFIPSTSNINKAEVSQLNGVSFATPSEQARTVAVVGEVNSPGSYVVVGGATGTDRSASGLPTVTRAIQLAGGLTPAADVRRIQIRRPTRTSGEQIININLWEFLQAGDLSQDTLVEEGDTIVIPTAIDINPAEVSQLADASFSTPKDQPRTVTVAGEVYRPGVYVVLGGSTGNERTRGGLPTVTQAIRLAGGITQAADIRRIQIRRPTKSGIQQVINTNLWQLLQTGDFSEDRILQEGDTIFIPTATDINPAEVTQLANASFSPENIQVSVVGEVVRPGTIRVPPNTTLNQALLVAGGFNNRRARRSEVDLIRLNSNGTVSRRKLPVDFTQGINNDINPLLENNDIIVVNRSRTAGITDTVDLTLDNVGKFESLFRLLGILFF